VASYKASEEDSRFFQMKFNLSLSPVQKIEKIIYASISSFGLWKVFFSSWQPEIIKIIAAVFLFFICFLFIKGPRKYCVSNTLIIWLFSGFLSASIVIGSMAVNSGAVFENISAVDLLLMIFSLLGLWVVIVNIVMFSTNFFSKYPIKNYTKKKIEVKLFCISWILLFLFWLPYLLADYPGHMTWDSSYQWMQAAGYIEMNNLHPILHTLLIKVCQKIGGLFSEDFNSHVAVYSFLQLSLIAAIFSYVIVWLKRYNAPPAAYCFVFAWFALHPIFGSYGILMVKDVLFGCFILLETLCIADIVLSDSKCLKNPVFIALWFIITVLCCLFRHNGLYAIIFTLFLLPFVINTKLKKQLSVFCISAIIVIFLISANIARKYSGIETFFFFFSQQIGRTVSHDGNISDNDRNAIEKITPLENIKEKYVSWLSDPVVVLFNQNKKEVSRWQYAKLWASLFFKNIDIYVDAFVYQTYGFWYPLVLSRDYIEKGINKNIFEQKKVNFEIAREPKSAFFNELLDLVFKITRFPGIALIWGIGTHIILIIYFGVVFCIRGNKRLLPCLLPCLSVWCTLLISTPLYIEWRYAFSFFTVLPVTAVLAFFRAPSINESTKLKEVKTAI
jgi:hypothetical protein